MTGRYTVRRRADLDVDEIADYIGRRNVSAGRRFLLAVRDDFAFLADNPGAGPVRASTPRTLRGLRS